MTQAPGRLELSERNGPGGLFFRAATAADIPALCRLFTQVFRSPMTPAAWEWKYGVTQERDAINVVGVGVDGSIAAHMGAQVYRAPGVRASVPVWIHGCDVMVAPGARGIPSRNGTYGRIVQALQLDVDRRYPGAFCFGFPGERPYRLGERLGFYRRLHEICLAEYALEAKGMRSYRWIGLQAIATAEELGSAATDCTRFGVVRTPSYLRWRYDLHPTRRYGAWLWRSGWRRYFGLLVEMLPDAWTVVDLIGTDSLDRSIFAKLARAARDAGCRWLRWDDCWTRGAIAGVHLKPTGIVAVWIRTPAGRHEKSGLCLTPSDTDVF